jgi:hypothetical protein
MTFQEWLKENVVELDKFLMEKNNDITWLIEMAWYDGVREGRRQAEQERIHKLVNGER